MRTETVTAPQALFLMNSTEVENASREVAERVLKDANNDLKSAVQAMYRLTVARPTETVKTQLKLWLPNRQFVGETKTRH